jgi:hypothetical protein
MSWCNLPQNPKMGKIAYPNELDLYCIQYAIIKNVRKTTNS